MLVFNATNTDQAFFGAWYGDTGVNRKLSIYSGPMHDVNVTEFYDTNYSSVLLATLNVAVQLARVTVDGKTTSQLQFSPQPATFNVNASRTGTATWFVLYNSTATNTSQHIIGTLSDQQNQGHPLVIDSVNLVINSPVMLYDLKLTVY